MIMYHKGMQFFLNNLKTIIIMNKRLLSNNKI